MILCLQVGITTLYDTLSINLHHNDTVYAYASTPLHCIIGQQEIIFLADTAVNVKPIPPPFVLHFIDSINLPFIDTSGIRDSILITSIGDSTFSDTSIVRDSTIWYMTFCKGR